MHGKTYHLFHSEDDDVVVLAQVRLPQVLCGEGGRLSPTTLQRSQPRVEDQPRIQLHAVGLKPGLGRFQDDPSVAGSDVEQVALSALERFEDVGHLLAGGRHVRKTDPTEGGENERKTDRAQGHRRSA